MKEEVKEKIIQKIEENLSESGWKIYDAMRYTPLSGGKLLRSQIILSAARDLSLKEEVFYDLCSAVEIFHSGTLIHDDLPDIDDANYRRGVKALHKVYGAGLAILAGDGLFFKSFVIVSNYPNLFSFFAKTAYEVLIGEAMDVEMEEKRVVGIDEVENMYRKKTGALFGFSFAAPLLYINDKRWNSMKEIGVKFGVAFQIFDDVKDIEGKFDKIGKDVGKDVNKKTLVKLLGIEKAKEKAESYLSEVKEFLVNNGFDNLRCLLDEMNEKIREG